VEIYVSPKTVFMYLRCRQTSLSPNATKPLAWRSSSDRSFQKETIKEGR
jgi:hypothetical protein